MLRQEDRRFTMALVFLQQVEERSQASNVTLILKLILFDQFQSQFLSKLALWIQALYIGQCVRVNATDPQSTQ